MCIDYACRPRLSSRLTQGGRTYPWKPLIFGHYDSHIILATHSGILSSVKSTCASLLYFSPFRPGLPTPGSHLCSVSVCLNFSGYGISTVCASTTPFGLALAPGLPVADEPTHGNLRFSAITILTQFSLLIPAFSLEYSPQVLPLLLHPVFDAPLPLSRRTSPSFGYMLSPVKFSAQDHSTSELLRTL